MTPLQVFARQHWIRKGIRERVLRAVCPPESFDDTAFETDFFGLRYRGKLSSYIDWSVYFYGAYEREYLFLIRDVLARRENPVFLDVGANVGAHSLFASKFAAEVHAFEPFPPVIRALEENVALNGLKNVHVHPFGLGDTTETLAFAPPSGINEGRGTFQFAAPDAIPLSVVRGDEFCANLPRIDLIKIDVEGFERAVLTGLRDTIARCRPTILCEYWGDLFEMRALLPRYHLRSLAHDMFLATH